MTSSINIWGVTGRLRLDGTENTLAIPFIVSASGGYSVGLGQNRFCREQNVFTELRYCLSESGEVTLVSDSQVEKRTIVGPSGGNSVMSNNLANVKNALTLLFCEILVDSALAWSWKYWAEACNISLEIGA